MTTTDITARFEPEIDAESEAAQRRTRLAGQVAAVRRRSRFIRNLRVWLPAAIVVLAVVNVGWIAVQSIISSLNVYGGATGEIRMTNPRYFGQSGKGDHYTVSGLEAVRKNSNDPQISLKSPSMDYKGSSERATHISAASGIYNQQTQLFSLKDNVIMAPGGSDITFRTKSAVVDVAKSIISGNDHIEGTGAMGTVTGESFAITDNGHNIVFRGRGDTQVHGLMKSQSTQGDKSGDVQISGDQWHATQGSHTELFDGRVLVIQNGGQMHADHVVINHAGGGADGKGWGDVASIQATGSIVYIMADKTMKGDNAVYTKATDTMVITGNVSLQQGQNITSGNRLVSQIGKGITTMDAAPAGNGSTGRVHSIFYPGTKRAPAKPATPPAHAVERP